MSSTGRPDFPIPAIDLAPGDSPDLVNIRLTRRGPAAPARARYRRAEDSRAAILQAVVDLVERDGGEPVHVDRIAERAGLHKMAIYRIFGSRAALLDEVAGRLCDGARALGRDRRRHRRHAARGADRLVRRAGAARACRCGLRLPAGPADLAGRGPARHRPAQPGAARRLAGLPACALPGLGRGRARAHDRCADAGLAGAVSPRWTDEEVAVLCDGLPAVVGDVIRGHVPAAAGAVSPIETCK